MRGLIFVLAVAFLAIVLLGLSPRRRRLSHAASSRDPAQAEAAYMGYFADVSGPVPTGVRLLLQRLLPGAAFPVLPEDDLWALYDLDQGTLESQIEDYFSENGRRWVPSSTAAPPRTVADLVRLVAACYSAAREI